MEVPMTLTLVILCFIAQNSALLFHGDHNPGQATTIGPLGKDVTISLLVNDFLDLKARVISQEHEIQILKNQRASEDNVTAGTVNKLMSEYVDIKAAFGLIKQEFDQNNNQTGLQALKARQDNMAQSIRYLTLSLQGHEMHDEETNRTIYHEIGQLNAKLVNENHVLHEEILNLTNRESAEFNRFNALLTAHEAKLATLGSEIAKQKTKLNNLNNTLLHIGDHKIRLAGGDSNSGRVEVLYLGQWGTVCDDNFDSNDAKVVCRMLGKATTNAVAFHSAHFGRGAGPIHFEDLECTGSEIDLFRCKRPPIGVHDCSHSEDAGVQCG